MRLDGFFEVLGGGGAVETPVGGGGKAQGGGLAGGSVGGGGEGGQGRCRGCGHRPAQEGSSVHVIVVSRLRLRPAAGQPHEIGRYVQVRGGRCQGVGLVRLGAAFFQAGDGRLRQAQRVAQLGLSHAPVSADQLDDPAVVAAPGCFPDFRLVLHGAPSTLRVRAALPAHAYAFCGYAYAGAACVMVPQPSVIVDWASAANAPASTGVAAAWGVTAPPSAMPRAPPSATTARSR